MITIGLIGCGIWGRAILRDLLSLGVSVKVFDSGQSTVGSQQSETTHHSSPQRRPLITHHSSLTDLADTDGLIVATPSSTHRAVLEKVLPWQLPTFVEKPLTTSLEDARFLASHPNSTYIYMMHVWRYHGGIQLLGELARSGKLGIITALRSTRSNWTSPRTDTDSVWNLAPHDLTIALEILGYIPTPKAAAIEWHQGMARGMTALLGDSPFVQIEVSNRSPDKRREVRLFGTEGVAVLADEKVDFVDVYYGDDLSHPSPLRHEKIYFDNTPPLRRELAAFIGFLKGGPAPISNFQEGLLTIEVLEKLAPSQPPSPLPPNGVTIYSPPEVRGLKDSKQAIPPLGRYAARGRGPRFTILLPTTHDRGLLLPYCVSSVLNQTVTDFELFIIGDGVSEDTRMVIQSLMSQDSRILFFDYPKHLRRGEPYRHEVLTQQASGQYIAYILDRDLWLPNHLEILLGLFEKGNFVATNYYVPFTDGSVGMGYSHPSQHLVFSTVAHTMAFYRSLPFGWRTTPPEIFTDDYMWAQCMAHPNYTPYFGVSPTVLYFKRGATYPGIPTKDRVKELAQWAAQIKQADQLPLLYEQAMSALLEERVNFRKAWMRIKGKTPQELIPFFKTKLTYSWRALERRVKYAMRGH